MTARMIPTREWGTVYVDEVQMTNEQQYACAACFEVVQVIVMNQGTIYCKEHAPNAQA